jgi:hypothetical protein
MVRIGGDHLSPVEDVIDDSSPHGTRTNMAPITPEEN